MANNPVLSLTALLALVPASILPYRRPEARRDLLFWSLLAVAVAGPTVYSATALGGGWHTSFAGALWVSTAVSALLFAALAAMQSEAWRLPRSRRMRPPGRLRLRLPSAVATWRRLKP